MLEGGDLASLLAMGFRIVRRSGTRMWIAPRLCAVYSLICCGFVTIACRLWPAWDVFHGPTAALRMSLVGFPAARLSLGIVRRRTLGPATMTPGARLRSMPSHNLSQCRLVYVRVPTGPEFDADIRLVRVRRLWAERPRSLPRRAATASVAGSKGSSCDVSDQAATLRALPSALRELRSDQFHRHYNIDEVQALPGYAASPARLLTATASFSLPAVSTTLRTCSRPGWSIAGAPSTPRSAHLQQGFVARSTAA